MSIKEILNLFLILTAYSQIVFSQKKLVEELPRFPDSKCEKLNTSYDKKECADKALLKYIQRNLRYPKLARQNRTYGKVHAQFTVAADGYLEDIHIINGIGDGCDQAVIELFENIVYDIGPWLPATRNDSLIRSTYTLTIPFILEDFPRFPNSECEKLNLIQERKECADRALLTYVYKYLKYPELAKKNGTQGRVYAQFTIATDGYLEDIIIKKGIGDGCDEAVLELIENMNYELGPWIPAMRNDSLVSILYTLPVSFKM